MKLVLAVFFVLVIAVTIVDLVRNTRSSAVGIATPASATETNQPSGGIEDAVEEAQKPWEGVCHAAGIGTMRFVATDVQQGSEGLYITEVGGKVTRLDGQVNCAWTVPQ